MVLDSLVTPAVEWLSATGAPNWMVFVAILSSPFLWAGYVKKGAAYLWDRYATA